ncbi:MAG: hypothetical protein R3D59_14015 [Paracoccaceae bacterium]
MSGVLRAWLVLVAASAATTGVALFGLRGFGVTVVLLALAMVKSRVILTDYLRLSQVPPIRRGFMAVLVLWALVALALALAAQS